MTDDERIMTRRRAIALMSAAGLAAMAEAYAKRGSESTLTLAPGGRGYVGAITMGVQTA